MSDNGREWVTRRGIIKTASLGLCGGYLFSTPVRAYESEYVYSASHDYTIKKTNNSTGNEVGSYTVGDWVFSAAISPDYQTIYYGTSGGVGALNAGDLTEVWSSGTGLSNNVFGLGLEHGGDYLYAADYDGNLVKYDASDGSVMWSTSPEPGNYTALGTNVKEGRIYVGDTNGDFIIADSSDGSLIDVKNSVTYNDPNNIPSITATPSGDRVYIGGGDGYLRAYEYGGVFLWEKNLGSVPESIAFSPDGSTMYVGTGNLLEMDLDGTILNEYDIHSGGIEGVDVDNEGDRIYTGSYDNTVKAVDRDTGNVVWTMDNHTDWVNDIAAVPNGPEITQKRSKGPQGIFALWDNFKAIMTAIIGAYALIGMWSRSLTIAAWAAYMSFIYMAMVTGTPPFYEIGYTTLVLIMVGFSFKLYREEIAGDEE